MNCKEYTPKQMEKIQEFIEETFGEIEYITHEIESKYVHTDAAVIKDFEGAGGIVTFGMGAEESYSPLDEFKHTELIAYVSPEFDFKTEEGLILANELIGLTKVPFRDNTWFGMGHTVPTSKKFKEHFGYDAFLMAKISQTCQIKGVGDVSFLLMIPIYNDERQWMIDNDSMDYFRYMNQTLDADDALFCDKERGHFIPDKGDDIVKLIDLGAIEDLF